METIKNMPDNARIWVYQSNKLLPDAEVTEIKKAGLNFIADWSAHGASLKASFDILYNRFIIISVDEQQAMASGCGIDKSVKFVKELEQQFNLNLFDRLQVAYRKGKGIVTCHISEFEKLADQDIINESTIVFNNMVTTIAAFNKEWEVPLKQSWHSRVLVNK